MTSVNMKLNATSCYSYSSYDELHKQMSSSSDSVHSALESFDEEYFSACDSISPPEAFNTAKTSNFFFDKEKDSLPNLLRIVEDTIDNLSKSLDDCKCAPKVLDPLQLTQSTPVKPVKPKIGSDISYPKLMVDEGMTPYRKNWGASDDQKIARGLVMERYEISYVKLLQKIKKLKLSPEENRFRTVTEELQSIFQQKEEEEISGSLILQRVMTSRKKVQEEIFYKEFADGKLQGAKSTISNKSDYEKHQFLQNPIGEESLRNHSSEEYIMCPPTTTSIETGEFSILLSSSFEAIKKRKHKSKKSIIFNSYDEENSRELVNEPFRYSYLSYEDITNLGQEIYSDEGKKQIKKHISINESIILQIEKMLKYGLKKTSRFIGSYMHLEAERVYLVSKMRHKLLLNYLYKVPESSLEAVAKVTIENLRCIINTSEEADLQQHHTQYFVCILQHKTTVYSTRISTPNKLGWVDFGGFFIFDQVSNTFNIKIELYSITIPKGTHQSCLLLPFFKSLPKLPMMQLTGEVHIGMLNIHNTKFTFKNNDNIKSQENKLSAAIEASINWPSTLKGYVTMGSSELNHRPVWNRKWCVLEDCILRYYNYPSEETSCPPLGSVDLHNCKGYEETPEKRLKNTVLRLVLDEAYEYKTILLSPETMEEYKQWNKHINIILTLIKQWNTLKKT